MSEIRCKDCQGKSTPRCAQCFLEEDKLNNDKAGIKTFICYLFGIGWAIYGTQVCIEESLIGGLLIVLAGLVTIPFTREKLNKLVSNKGLKFNITNTTAFVFAIACFVIYSTSFAPQPTPEELAARAKKQEARQQLIAKEKADKEAAEREEECQEKIMPYVKSQMFVRNQLKSPSTADFPLFSDNQIEYAGNCTHRIRSYVDSQNAFGAIVRTAYYVEIKRGETEEDWQLIDFKFDTVQ